MLASAVRLLRQRLGAPLASMRDDEVAALGLAGSYPLCLERFPSLDYEDNLRLMHVWGLITTEGDEHVLTEKGEELRVQFGLLRGGEP